MAADLTPDEAARLAPFLTNLDRPVFALRNLPEVVKGAVFSRYSRTAKSLRRVLLDEFLDSGELSLGESPSAAGIDVERAESFYGRVLVGYGDDSVAELGFAHLALEGLSNLATKAVEEARIGLSPLEKSTRYVAFDQRVGGRWDYLRPQELDQAGLLATFEMTCDHLFETYASLMPQVLSHVRQRFPQEEGEPDIAYRSTVRAKACDILRGLLPAATRTNMGVAGNGRAFEYLLVRLQASPLAEVRDLASAMHGELMQVIPAFVRRSVGERGAEAVEAVRGRFDAEAAAAAALGGMPGGGSEAAEPGVRLLRSDADGMDRVIAAMAFPASRESMATLVARAGTMTRATRSALIEAYLAGRRNRRHRPGRAFEEAALTVEVVANFGAYRDLQRHRLMSQQRQPLTCDLGYDIPVDLEEAGLAAPFREAVESARETWLAILPLGAQPAQYVVPLAYRTRWQMTLNIREAFHICELRSTEQGHPDYRRVAVQLADCVAQAYPEIAGRMAFLDRTSGPGLERRESERRLARRREALST